MPTKGRCLCRIRLVPAEAFGFFLMPHIISQFIGRHLPSKRLSLCGGDRALFDLLVKISLERGLRLRAEVVALLLRAEPLLRALSRTRHRLLRARDSTLHRDRHARLPEVRRDAPLLGLREDRERVCVCS